MDFEKRIASIYQQCRTPIQIRFEFDALQKELEADIAEGQHDAREKLLDNFDQEVVEKVRIESHDYLDRFNDQLWRLTRYILEDYANFEETGFTFVLHTNPFPGETIHPGPYRMGKNVEDANTYRVGHPLAQKVLERGQALVCTPREVTFQLTGSGRNIAVLTGLVGQSGWLTCSQLSVSSLETEDHTIATGFTDAGEPLDEGQCRRLFDLFGDAGEAVVLEPACKDALDQGLARRRNAILEDMSSRESRWFNTEIDKLDRWADDRRASLKSELDELDDKIKETKKAARLAPNLPEKLERQRELRQLETKRDEAWHAYDAARKELEQQKDGLLDEISERLKQGIQQEALFTLRWHLA